MEIGKAFSPMFIEALRKMIEKELNYEYSWNSRSYVRKKDRSANDLSQKERPFVTVAEITGFEDYTYYGGYCETCSYEETHCRVQYRTADGDLREYEYDGTFASLLSNLVDDE